jgi:hypothetical protein
MVLTEKEYKRLSEIEAKAIQNYLDYNEYYLIDWVDDKDIEEYTKLLNKNDID